MPKVDNVGVVAVSKEHLMRVLGYKDGKLISIDMDDEHGFGLVKFLIEHPTMPEAHEGDYIPVVDTIRMR